MVKKVSLFGQFRPTGVDASGSAALRAVAKLTEQATDVATGVAIRKQAELARSKGLQESEKAAQEDRQIELTESVTRFGRNFNEAAVLAHQAKIRRDTTETLNSLENEHRLNPDAFKQSADAMLEGLTKEMPEQLAAVVREDTREQIAKRNLRLQDQFFKREHEKNVATVIDAAGDLQDEILNAARSGDAATLEKRRTELKALMARGVETDLISPIQAKKQAEQLQERILVNQEIGKIQSVLNDDSLNFDERIVAATKMVDDARVAIHKDLSPEQRDALADQMNAELNSFSRKEAEFNAQAEKEIAQEVADLKFNVTQGLGDANEHLSHAQDLFSNQRISESEYLGIKNRIFDRDRKLQELAISDARVARRLAGDLSVALTDQEIDSFYDRNILNNPEIAQLDPVTRSARLSQLVKDLGAIPKSLKRQTLNNLNSSDPDLIIESAALIDEVDRIPGLSDREFTPRERAFATVLNDLSANMDPREALKIANEITDPRNTARIEAIEQEIKSEKYREDYEDKVRSEFEGIFGSEIPELTASQITKEYQNLFESHFKAGMNKEQAEAQALKMLARNWTESEATGRVMKYAPDQYYHVNGNVDYIKQQALSEIKANFLFGDDEDVVDVFFQSDKETARLATKGQPDYIVYVVTNEGVKPLVDENLKVLRWKPDVSKEAERQKKANKKTLQTKRVRIDPESLEDKFGAL